VAWSEGRPGSARKKSQDYFDTLSTPVHNEGLGNPAGEADFMQKIIEYRAQEQMCRQRATFDPQHKHYWLSQAEMWWHKVQDEISAHFEECTPPQRTGGSMPDASMPGASMPGAMNSKAHA